MEPWIDEVLAHFFSHLDRKCSKVPQLAKNPQPFHTLVTHKVLARNIVVTSGSTVDV
jgi:hypothetical protein